VEEEDKRLAVKEEGPMKLITILCLAASIVMPAFGQSLTVLPFNYNSQNLAVFPGMFPNTQSPNIQVWIFDSTIAPSGTYQVSVFYRDQAGNALMDSRSVANQNSPTGITIVQFLHDDSTLDLVIVQSPTGPPAIWTRQTP